MSALNNAAECLSARSTDVKSLVILETVLLAKEFRSTNYVANVELLLCIRQCLVERKFLTALRSVREDIDANIRSVICVIVKKTAHLVSSSQRNLATESMNSAKQFHAIKTRSVAEWPVESL